MSSILEYSPLLTTPHTQTQCAVVLVTASAAAARLDLFVH